MTSLPEEYRLAREIWNMIVSVPLGQRISRAEINLRLRAESNTKKIELISKILRNLLLCGQIQKMMYRDSCQVVFWATQNSTERGEPLNGVPSAEERINYLIDPPPPPPPPSPTPPPSPPPVVPPPEPETLLMKIQALMKRKEYCTLRLLCSYFPSRKEEVVDLVEMLWTTRELCRDSRSSLNNVQLWLPSIKSKWVNDPLPDDEPAEESDDTDNDQEENDLFMMKDTKNKNQRILLRPTGDTLTLTIEEIEFIRKLKKPYVTL